MRAKVACDGDTQTQSPDKEFVKVVIDNGNETDDNAEVYNDDYNSDNLGDNGENEVPAVELETVEEADQLEDLCSQPPQSPDKEFVNLGDNGENGVAKVGCDGDIGEISNNLDIHTEIMDSAQNKVY